MKIEAIAPTGATTQARSDGMGAEARQRAASAVVPPATDRVQLSALAQHVADHEAVALQLDPRILAALITREASAAPNAAPADAGRSAASTTDAPKTVKGL